MPNTFDSVPASITQRAMANNFSLEEKSRRESALLNKDFYYGKQEKHLITVNDDQLPFTLNLTQPVVKKRSTLLYKKPLQREFTGPSNSISFIESVYADNSIDSLLNQVDLLSELTGSALVMPEVVEVSELYTQGIKLRIFDSSAFSALADQENPNEAEAISIIRLVDRLASTSTKENPQVERVLVQQIWTKDAVVRMEGHLIKGSSGNDFGFLPFVNFKGEEVYDQYLGHAPATLIRKANHDINQVLTDLGYMIKMQSATPIALEGYQAGEGITIHPGRAFSMPSGAKATVLQLNPKIQETLEFVKFLEEKVFENSSVPKITIVGGEGQSGRELLVRWFPLLQVFQEKTVRFEKYELELANMILRVAGLPTVEEVHVDYPEADLLPLSTSEETMEQDFRFNLSTPIDEMMRRNPELSEEEAQVEVLANKEINDNLMSTPGGEDDESSEEDPDQDGDGEGEDSVRDEGSSESDESSGEPGSS